MERVVPTIVSRDSEGRLVYLRQRGGERFRICCLQSEPCIWHDEHGDEIKQEPGTAVPAQPKGHPQGKRAPKSVIRFLAEQPGMFDSESELYDYILAKRRQWEDHPDVSWVPFLAYMMQCEYTQARAMARWTRTLDAPVGGHQHAYEPQGDGVTVRCHCGDVRPRCGADHLTLKGHLVCAREADHQPPHRAGKASW